MNFKPWCLNIWPRVCSIHATHCYLLWSVWLQGNLDKQLYKVERKYSKAERKLQEQKEKERQNKVRRSNMSRLT